MCNKIPIISIILLSLCFNSYAQETGKGAIGIFCEYSALNNLQSQLYFYGVEYQHRIKKNIQYEVCIGLGKIEKITSDDFSTGRNDTFINTVKLSYIRSLMPIFSYGINVRHRLYRKLSWHYGCDAGIGYNVFKKDTLFNRISRGFYDSNGFKSYGSYTEKNNDAANIFYLGIAPNIGIQADLKNYTVGIAASILVSQPSKSL